VGKTEIARSLADELGVKLVRFDMSEYGEKHAVAKLIGAPAGYVGYEEGGILTEEIRKMGTVDPQPNHNWKFVPEEWTTPALERDYKQLFGEKK
jgi:hypothetical protein